MVTGAAADPYEMPEGGRSAGRIIRLDIENFKSYKGKHSIGPFYDFTAIIGPNGSGKSNLMDAISFVLGVRTHHLRGNLKELLYFKADSGEAQDQPTRGSVKMVFEKEDGSELHFSRSIQPSAGGGENYQSVYKINEKTSTLDAYNEQLKNLGILVKARNFLVFQGDIESVVSRSPKELGEFFEQISGADALKREYEELREAKEKSEEKHKMLFGKKKLVTQEKRQRKEEKEEVEKARKLQDELGELRSEQTAFSILQLSYEIDRARAELASLESSTRDLSRQHAVAERALDERRKEHARVAKEKMVLEKKTSRRRAEAEVGRPSRAQVGEEALRLTKRVKAAEGQLQKLQAEARRNQEEIAKLEGQLEGLAATQADLAAEEAAEAEAEGSVKLQQAQVKEYERLQREAVSRAHKLQADLDALKLERAALDDRKTASEDAYKEVAARIEELGSVLEDTKRKRAEIAKTTTTLQEDLDGKRKERDRVAKEARRALHLKETMGAELTKLDSDLRDMRQDKRESERERKCLEAIDALKRVFPQQVYGRLSSLAEVINKRYALAVTVAMQREMDAVVVESERTARDAIDYLKAQQVPPMTFLPLDSLKTKPINERLRHLQGTAKLAVDLIQYESKYEKAFIYSMGNTLVCDTQDEAKRLAFDGSSRNKVVSLDGTLIAKSGNMTGGVTTGLEQRSRGLDEKMVDRLKERKAKLEEDLAALPDVRELQHREKALGAEIDGLEKKLEFLKLDDTAAAAKAREAQAACSALEEQRAGQLPALKKAREALKGKEGEIKKMQSRVNEVKDTVFADFSRSLGIASIREYEEGQLARARRYAERRAELEQQISRVTAQLVYERSKDAGPSIRKKEEEIERDREGLAKLKKEEHEARKRSEALEAELGGWTKELQALQRKLEELDVAVAELRSQAAKLQSEGAKLQRQQAAQAAALEGLEGRREDAKNQATVSGIDLPTREGADPSPSGSESESDEEHDDDEETEAEGRKRKREGAGGKKRKKAAGARGPGPALPEYSSLNFSIVRKELRRALPTRDKEKADAEFSAAIEALLGALSKLQPNMKAADQFEAIKNREKEQAEALEVAKAEMAAATKAFAELKGRRESLFLGCVGHCKRVINQIYKELTRTQAHPYGGEAYLEVLDATAPLGGQGVQYSAMPPAKRFCEMHLLSGGEKTLAALALLFAVHSFRPSPFFVLDEVDAALDMANVGRVAAYIRERTRLEHRDHREGRGGDGGEGGPPHAKRAKKGGAPGGGMGSFQGIVISLKDNFFDKADALVGVTRNVDSGCSAVFTFDLNQHEELQGQAEGAEGGEDEGEGME